jgi:signal transduction histidine kinase/ActR/RegA family two-component response regulator
MTGAREASAGPVVRRRGPIALYAGFTLLIAAVASSIWFTVRQQDAFVRVNHTLGVESQLAQIVARLQEAETSSRGFLLTGRSDFLEPYEEAMRALPADLGRLRGLLADNSSQIAQVDLLRDLAAERMRYLRLGVAYYWRGVPNSPENFLRGQEVMGRFRDLAEEMRAEEDRLLALRTANANQQARWAAIALGVSAALVIMLLLLAIRESRKRVAEAEAARDALAETNRQLTEEHENRAAAEATVRQMQKVEAIGQLTGGIAHDFNNMLAVVIGSLDMAQKRLDKGETPRAMRLVDNAMEGAQRAARLTARLLAFSRQQPLEPQAVDPNRLVSGMSEILQRTIGDDIRMETVLAGGLWPTFVDPGQLENAILNLCINGRDAMPQGGKLTVETANSHLDDAYAEAHPGTAVGQYVMISVTDTGCGMAQDVAERAFDPFFTTKGAGKGTGLGLSQVHGFIRQSGGHLKIYSEPGHGTTVKLYLPRHLGSVEADALDGVSGTAGMPRADGEVVLVVEDDDRVRHVSADALRELGYTVMQAPDAHHALAMVATPSRIDLLFTDVVMPDVNGRELADRARAMRPDLKVLYTTGYTKNAIVHNGTLDPGVDMLPKPFTVDQLARKVRQVIDREG